MSCCFPEVPRGPQSVKTKGKPESEARVPVPRASQEHASLPTCSVSPARCGLPGAGAASSDRPQFRPLLSPWGSDAISPFLDATTVWLPHGGGVGSSLSLALLPWAVLEMAGVGLGAPFGIARPFCRCFSGHRCSALWKGNLGESHLEHCDLGRVWELARATGKVPLFKNSSACYPQRQIYVKF